MTLDQQMQSCNAVGTWLAGIATFTIVVVSLRRSIKTQSLGGQLWVPPMIRVGRPNIAAFTFAFRDDREKRRSTYNDKRGGKPHLVGWDAYGPHYFATDDQ
jgi:hypothetical protein